MTNTEKKLHRQLIKLREDIAAALATAGDLADQVSGMEAKRADIRLALDATFDALATIVSLPPARRGQDAGVE